VKQWEETVKSEIYDKISAIDLRTLQRVLSSRAAITNHASHPIIQTTCPKQPKPFDDKYYKSDAVEHSICCPVVFTYLQKRFGLDLLGRQAIELDLFRSIPETATTAGDLWELRGNTRFCKGGDFTLVRMMKRNEKGNCLIQVNESKTISIKPMTGTPLDKKSVCQPGEYYIPTSEREPAFDTCFLLNNELIALQFTTSDKHTTEDNGFSTLIKMRPKTCTEQSLVYVVPKARAEKFTCDAPSKYWLGRFKFYVLALDCKYCPSSADV